ncbi:NADH-quinone oxidoreductase subunit C [Propionicicella superfundia]|uniref:NADH-quinone oxidoreductase subunit C n=1 Tax=Propionicicella superfundia TaxID=348582 RepID=UPI000419AAEC|nr:NADH-quinone oxidoreductase subunit C [Propionicicella superfundia]
MSDDKAAEKTISEKVTDPEAAPKEGVEREDAQPGAELETAGETFEGRVRTGMWSDGSGDTSGYGRITRVVAPPQATEAPLGEWYDDAARRLSVLVQDPILKAVVDRGELTLYVPREKIVEILQQLRDDAHLRFESFSGVSGVHYPEATGEEFHVVYHLQSMTHNRRLRVEATVPDADPHIASVVPVYPAADWHERETWDMFGVIFDGHPSLTRILMPDDWVGHPQRKDYPLGGIPVEYKGAVVPPPDQRRTYR